MLKDGIIEPSSSLWVSCPVITKKKDGGDRFCIDLQKVNDVTIKHSYPLPRIDDLLDEIGKARWYSLIDLKWGYWQIALVPDDNLGKTAFTTPLGLSRFTVMPFELCHMPRAPFKG